MLYLNPPYQTINGYTLLPDHADPNLFYVLPSMPRLAELDGKPEFSLLQYLGGGAGTTKLAGGILTLTTELTVPDSVLASLRDRIKQKFADHVTGAIQLQPVLFDSGVVELIALGNSSTTSSTGTFDLRFLGTGKPSLSGNNTASFQLLLDTAAAELIERSLDAPDLPIVAIYRMTFAGLRPSFQINIQADWRKVYRSITNRAKANVYFVGIDAEAIINEALEENNIKIDTAVFGTDETAKSSADRARKQLTDWVLEHLFAPAPSPSTASQIGQVIDESIWSLTRSLVPGVSYRLRMVEDEQLRMLSAQMNESVAERREVIPQATIGGVLKHYRLNEQGQFSPDWQALRSSLVQKVNLDGFPRLEVKIAAEDRFATDGITEVQVEIGRINTDKTIADTNTYVFRNASDRKDYIVNLLGMQPANFATPYRYRALVKFDPTHLLGAHDPVSSDWQASSATELYVEPRSAYILRELSIGVSPTFSFTQFPTVTVELRYIAEGSTALQTGRTRLTIEQPSQVWRFRSFIKPLQPYEYRLTYHRHAANGGDIQTEWKQSIDDWLFIPDPLPVKRTLNIFINLPWTDINFGFVQLRYNDDHNDIHFDEQIDLDPQVRHLRRDYPIAAAGPRVIQYRLTLLMNSGDLLEGSWRETSDERLILDRKLVDRRTVTIRTIGGTWAESRLAEVQLKLQIREPQTEQIRTETQLHLSDANPSPLVWDYLAGDPPTNAISFSAVFVNRDGFITQTPWTTTQSDLLIVSLRNQTITG